MILQRQLSFTGLFNYKSLIILKLICCTIITMDEISVLILIVLVLGGGYYMYLTKQQKQDALDPSKMVDDARNGENPHPLIVNDE
jgi:hypothetical protein